MRALARPVSSRVSIGSTKDAVLPVPVWAMPSTSLPCSACGMAPTWIGVGISIAGIGDCGEDLRRQAEVCESQRFLSGLVVG